MINSTCAFPSVYFSGKLEFCSEFNLLDPLSSKSDVGEFYLTEASFPNGSLCVVKVVKVCILSFLSF